MLLELQDGYGSGMAVFVEWSAAGIKFVRCSSYAAQLPAGE